MALYATVGGLNFLGSEVPFSVSTSFGNMGFPKPVCGKDIFNWGSYDVRNLHFECERRTHMAKVLDKGIQLSQALKPFGTDNTLASCDYKSLIDGSPSKQATDKYFDHEKLVNDFEK